MRRLTLGLSISGENVNSRYFGKSSSMTFMKEAMEYANAPSGSTFEAQRPDFWVIPPFFVPEPVPPQIFPDDDLLQTLLDLYFGQINPITFLLHSPSFRASVANGEHLRDRQFGFVVLTVCALASRFSDDPRVLPTPDSPLHLAGWKWFEQVRALHLITSPDFPWLLKLQLICLSVLFLAGTAVPPECWLLAGVGMRMAQQMGAHRRSRYSVASKIEAELLRRVFWFLVSMDTILSSAFGRPAATTSEDYDVDLPMEVDDEYWDAPHNFQQPTNKTAQATYATSYLKLMEIFNRAQRTIYPVKVGKECGPEAVAELDSALNIWVDSIPSHLRWDSNREGIFLDQSASLYITYYYVQILIHRPFIPIPGKTPVTHSHFPSLAICANSARSCGHVMEVQSRRGGGAVLQPFVITALFDSAVILLLNVWGAQRATLAPSDISRAVADIKKCVDVLHLYEKRWPVAGRHCDTITEMLNRAISRPVSLRPSLKRPVPEDPLPVDPPASTTVQQLEQLELSIKQTDHLFSLPLSTQELGLLPVYESFDFHYDVGQHEPSSSFTNGFSGAEYLQVVNAEQSGFVPPAGGPQETTAAFSWQDWSSFADQDYKWEP
ncbi:fungal-specific transcription factor domain-containing protein [Mycena metata]|uniref:Fungal-specific transcription factor domain-containing protein n=1 Tax=Mycena metata TaxID=1033252 RepID=A0AAD7NLW0_9AGAR|nr:fungal-specific transcription factor domain-containing protein [Mycena metata]